MSTFRRRFWITVLAMFGFAGLVYLPSFGRTQQGRPAQQNRPSDSVQNPAPAQPKHTGKGDSKQSHASQARPKASQPVTQPSSSLTRQSGFQPLPHQTGRFLGSQSPR